MIRLGEEEGMETGNKVFEFSSPLVPPPPGGWEKGRSLRQLAAERWMVVAWMLRFDGEGKDCGQMKRLVILFVA